MYCYTTYSYLQFFTVPSLSQVAAYGSICTIIYNYLQLLTIFIVVYNFHSIFTVVNSFS